ncbi:MAG: alkaline phosphatase family protein [Patescibacteria group bacterium]|jgi:predicted AlkP superfamily phosphohydrolase/phosphomutase
MKNLIIGIDGGDLEIFEKFDMPFLKSLIEKGKKVELTENLLSRGWVEIISGKYAKDNKSFYIFPKLDGTHDFSLSYSFGDLIKNNDGSPLIWELAEKKGYKIGVMNVPTTYPAPKKINGFFVSGAGGGLYSVEGIPEEMCSDKETQDLLTKNGYILELRFKPSGITDKKEMFEKMNLMMKKRFQSYTELAKKNNIDFGFIALRATANLQYVIMSEIKNLFDLKNNKKNTWEKYIKEHYEILDKEIEKIFFQLKPDNFVITADHGMTNQEYHSNYNVFLNRNNYLKKDITLLEILKYSIKRIIFPIKNLWGYRYLKPSIEKINWEKTKVFGGWYSNGLYINDQKRFNGPVIESEINNLVKEVCDQFNKSAEAKKFNLQALPYRDKYKNSKFYDFLPDIRIKAPDNIFFLGKGPRTINQNPWFKIIKSLKHIPSSMFTGTKGRHPVCIMNKELANLIKEDDIKDLTLIYKIMERYFQL